MVFFFFRSTATNIIRTQDDLNTDEARLGHVKTSAGSGLTSDGSGLKKNVLDEEMCAAVRAGIYMHRYPPISGMPLESGGKKVKQSHTCHGPESLNECLRWARRRHIGHR